MSEKNLIQRKVDEGDSNLAGRCRTNYDVDFTSFENNVTVETEAECLACVSSRPY